MEYLVESHLGGYYVSNLDPQKITEYCEQCGDSDWIILSWEEGQMIETLKEYFSYIKMTRETINMDRINGITKSEAIDSIQYYSEIDKNIISILFEDKIITEEEKRELMKINLQTKKRQISLVCEIYPNNKKKILKK